MLNLFLHHKRDVLLKLVKNPKSPAREILINILKHPNSVILKSVAHHWCLREYKNPIYDEAINIPKSLLPKTHDHEEFFKWLTKELKMSIKPKK